MNIQIYVCDLPPDCGEEEINALFEKHGSVTAIEWLPPRDGTDLRRALVTVDTEKPVLVVVGQLNGRSVGEQPIVATPAAPPDGPYELSRRQIQVSNDIAVQLHEKFKWPRMMIQQTVGLCGVRFAQEMARRAQAIEDAGGMLVPDGSRRRTVGGIFFALTRQYVTPEIGRAIFYGTRQAVKELKASARKAAAEAAQAQPATPVENAAPAAEPVPAPKPPAPPKPEPVPDPEALNAARERLDALRRQMQAAQAELEAMKRGQAQRTTGVFTLMKQVVDAQKAIDALLAEHPGLQ